MIGLSMGADDYVTKPFNPMELTARVKSQLRRYTSLGDIHSSGGEHHCKRRLTFNLDEHVLYADGEPVKLTATETKIVELLMRNPAASSRRRRFTARFGTSPPTPRKTR